MTKIKLAIGLILYLPAFNTRLVPPVESVIFKKPYQINLHRFCYSKCKKKLALFLKERAMCSKSAYFTFIIIDQRS